MDLRHIQTDYCKDYESLFKNKDYNEIDTEILNNFITKYELLITYSSVKAISKEMSYKSFSPQRHPIFALGILDFAYNEINYHLKYYK